MKMALINLTSKPMPITTHHVLVRSQQIRGRQNILPGTKSRFLTKKNNEFVKVL